MKSLYEVICPYPLFESGVMKQLLEEEMQNLPKDQQRLLDLRYRQGKAVSKIAKELDSPAIRVYHRLNRAIFTLQKIFYPEYFAEGYNIIYGNPKGPEQLFHKNPKEIQSKSD